MQQPTTKPRRTLFAAGRIAARRPSVDRILALAAALDGRDLHLTIIPLPPQPQEAA